MEKTGQFMKDHNFKPIEKQSSFYFVKEKFNFLYNFEDFNSKKIEFLDVDAVW